MTLLASPRFRPDGALAWMPMDKKSLTEPRVVPRFFGYYRGIAAGRLFYLCTDVHNASSLIQLR